MANIENPHQATLAFQNGLESIGLFRTKFLAILSNTFSTEEEQYDVYHQVVDVATGKPVAIRTFDIGADKQSLNLHRCTDQNPALGVRGIRRHLLHHPKELRTQMRAILEQVDSVRVGTNDLLQYFMAADRDNTARRSMK